MDIKILSIETSGQICSVGLSKNQNIISQYTNHTPNIHDELAAELINRVLDDSKLTVGDLSAVAVSSGPGSFTGLRIGVSLAKGLCFSADNLTSPKLIAVPTLKSLINFALRYKNLHNYDSILSVVTAQKDLVYYQEYSSGNYSEIMIGNKTDLDNEKYKRYLKIGPYFLGKTEFDFLNNFSAEKIAMLAYEQYYKNDFVDPEKFTPDYIQDFIVKNKRKGLNI